MDNNTTDDDVISVSVCQSIVYKEIESVGIRLWDVFILVPNLLFLGVLCILFQRARMNLYATNSPFYFGFYALIWICAIFSVLRCVISMGMSSLHLDTRTQDIANMVLWAFVHFVLLTAEVSVLIFSLAFGRLEIKAVLSTIGIISLIFSVLQGTLEFLLPGYLGVYGHGGVIFLLTTSTVFMLLYLGVYLLPYTNITNVISIPVRPSFYRYALILFCNCLLLTVGCVLVLSPLPQADCGYCLINLAHYLYFSFFIPSVYLMYLNDYCYQPPKIPISYTMNESMYEDNGDSIDSTNTFVDDDNHTFMHHGPGNGHQLAAAAAATGGDAGAGCSSTSYRDPNGGGGGFILNGPVYKAPPRTQDQINYHRFLYNTNIQSPGSMTGYSSVEESTTAHGSMEFIQQQQRMERGRGEEEENEGKEEAVAAK